MKLNILPERLPDFPQCPNCESHGDIQWDEWWCGTEYMEGRVSCGSCGWFPPDSEAIEIGLGMGRMFMPTSLDEWVKAARLLIATGAKQ